MTDDPLAAEALLAELNVADLRRRRDRHVRWACLASTPLWVKAFVPGVPATLAWAALLGQGYAAAMAVAYAALAARWRRLGHGPPRSALP